MSYVRAHWRGDLSLGRAFWINLVAVRAVLICGDLAFQPPITKDLEPLLAAAVAYTAFSVGVVLPWQIVGVVRSTDRMLGELGAQASIIGAQIGIVVSLLVVGSSVFATFQPLWREPPPEEPHFLVAERERRAKYDLSVSEDGKTVLFAGDFEIGVTRALRALLADNPGVAGIAFESDGGFVNQGRGVAKAVAEHGLDTYVFTHCKSACAIAFMAGERRFVGRQGIIGFHQYFYEGRTPHPTLDWDVEFRRDLDYFESRGVDRKFLEQALSASHEEIWIPERAALLAAGAVHAIADENPFTVR